MEYVSGLDDVDDGKNDFLGKKSTHLDLFHDVVPKHWISSWQDTKQDEQTYPLMNEILLFPFEPKLSIVVGT